MNGDLDQTINLLMNTQPAIKTAEDASKDIEKALTIDPKNDGYLKSQKQLLQDLTNEAKFWREYIVEIAIKSHEVEKSEENKLRLDKLASDEKAKQADIAEKEAQIAKDQIKLEEQRKSKSLDSTVPVNTAKRIDAENQTLARYHAELAQIHDEQSRLSSIQYEPHWEEATDAIELYATSTLKAANIAEQMQIRNDYIEGSTERVAAAEASVTDEFDKAAEAATKYADSAEQAGNVEVNDSGWAEQVAGDTAQATANMQEFAQSQQTVGEQSEDTSNVISELIAHIRELKENIRAVEAGEKFATADQYKEMNIDLEKSQRRLREYRGEVDRAANSSSKAGSRNNIAAASFMAIKSAAQKAIKSLKGFNIISTLGNKLKSTFGSVQSSIHSIRKSLTSTMKHLRSSLKHGFSNFTKYILGFKSLYFLVRRLRKFVVEGLENLAQYNDKISKGVKSHNLFNDAMNSLQTSLLYLKNAWAAAFAPIVIKVMPILTGLIDYLAVAGNAIAKFVAELTGQETAYNAIKIKAQDYADSLEDSGSSAKKAKKDQDKLNQSLADYDKLLVIKSKNDDDDNGSPSGSGGGSSYSPDIQNMFKTITGDKNSFASLLGDAIENANFREAGTLIGQAIKDGLDNINWDEIQKKVNSVGKKLGQFLRGLFNTEGLMESVGKTVGEVVNTISGFIDAVLTETAGIDFGKGFAELVNGFFKATNWDLIATNIENFAHQLKKNVISFLKNLEWDDIKNAFNTLASALGKAFVDIVGDPVLLKEIGKGAAELINTITGAIEKFLEQTDGVDFGSGLAGMVNEFFATTDWDKIGKNIETFVSQLRKNITTFLMNINWNGEGGIKSAFSKLGESIGSAISDTLSDKVFMANVGKSVAEVLNTIVGAINGLFKGTKGKDVGGGLATSLNNALKTFDFSQLGETLSNALIFVFSNASSFLEKVDWEEFGKAVQKFLEGIDWIEVLTQVARFIVSSNNALTKVLAAIGDGVSDTLMKMSSSDIEKTITSFIENIDWKGIADATGRLLQAVVKSTLATGHIINVLFSALVDAIWKGLKNLSTTLADAYGEVVDELKSEGKAVNAINIFAKLGGKLMGGLLDGIKSAFSSYNEWGAKYIGKPILDYFANELGVTPTQFSTTMKSIGTKFVEGFKTGVSTLWDKIKGTFVGENSVINNIKKNLNIDTIKSNLEKGWSTVTGVFSSTWSNIGKFFAVSNPESIWYKLKEKFSADYIKTNIANGLSSAWSAVTNVFGGTWNKISKFFSVSNPESIWYKLKEKFSADYIKTNIVKGFTTAWGNITSVFSGTWDKISKFFSVTNSESIWYKLKEKFSVDYIKTNIVKTLSKAWENVTGVFSGTWDKIKQYFAASGPNSLIQKIKDAVLGVAGKKDGKNTFIGGIVGNILDAFDKLKSKIKDPINGVLDIIQGFVNDVMKGLNILIGKINGLQIKIPKIGGGENVYGFNFPKFPEDIKIPHLAQGAVIPPNKAFMAMLGDQRQGTNIETPLDTMVEAFKIALADGGNTKHEPIVLQLSGRVVAQAVWDEEAKKYKQTGFGLAY